MMFPLVGFSSTPSFFKHMEEWGGRRERGLFFIFCLLVVWYVNSVGERGVIMNASTTPSYSMCEL